MGSSVKGHLNFKDNFYYSNEIRMTHKAENSMNSPPLDHFPAHSETILSV